jgi:formate dehydrogenase maturation protein FdhE
MKTLILRKERRLLLENAKVYQKYPNRTRRKKNYNSNTQTMENINEKKIKIMELYTPKIIYEYKEMTEEKEKQVKEWLEKTREAEEYEYKLRILKGLDRQILQQ